MCLHSYTVPFRNLFLESTDGPLRETHSDATIVHINQLHSVMEDLRHVTLKNPCEINKDDLLQEIQSQGNMPHTHLDIVLGIA